MIKISRCMLRTKIIFFASSKIHQIQSSNIHVLCSRQPRSRTGPASVFSLEINQIIARFESSDAGTKDLTPSLHQQPTPLSDGLPDLTTLQNTTTDIPDIVSETADALVTLNKLGEPSLQSLDLGCYYTPVGWIQNLLEWTHCTFNLPWWASISVCVIIARIILFPLVVKSQKQAAKMHNVMPQMQEIQTRLQHARTYGNDIEAMKIGLELAQFMKKNNVNPTSSLGLPLLQAPVFISFFWGLRGMANAPVESFKHGGLWWFEDLTIPDPFFILPTVTCATLFLTIHAGVDMNNMPSRHPLLRHMPNIMKAIPFIGFPFMMYFPSAVLCYWGTTNVVSLIQVLILKIPKVRKYYGIETKVKHDPSASPFPNKQGMVKGFKSSWKNMKIAREIEERDRLDDMAFKKAGRAPPAKTFKENPLLEKEPLIQAKKQ